MEVRAQHDNLPPNKKGKRLKWTLMIVIKFLICALGEKVFVAL
jgi:hypothetical protein